MGSRVRRLCSWFGSFAEVGERCGIGRRRANSSTTTDVAGEAQVAPAKAHRDQAHSGNAVAGLDSFGDQRRWKASWAEVGNAVDAASVELVLTHESCGRRRLASCSCGDIGCQRLVGSLRYAVEYTAAGAPKQGKATSKSLASRYGRSREPASNGFLLGATIVSNGGDASLRRPSRLRSRRMPRGAGFGLSRGAHDAAKRAVYGDEGSASVAARKRSYDSAREGERDHVVLNE